jgi:hypothetical protein
MSGIEPLIAAGIGAASSIHSSRQQSKAASKARRLQQDQIAKQEGLQRKQEQVAEIEKQKLQKEESDEQRSRRRRGRRSLISGNEQGVDTLGQRIGEI